MVVERGVEGWVRSIRRRDSTHTPDEDAALRGVRSQVVERPADVDVVRDHDRQTRQRCFLVSRGASPS